MALTLITTAPNGHVTRNNPVMRGPQIVMAVSETLRRAAPWMTRRERDRVGLLVARGHKHTTHVHAATGYSFRIETAQYVVTFNPCPITGPGALDGLRRMTLDEARTVVATAARIPKRGRIINADTLAEEAD